MIDWEALEESPEDEISRLCGIDTQDLESTMQQHAALYGYSAAAHEVSKVNLATAKWRIDQTKAKVFSEQKEENPKKAVSAIEGEIDNDQRMIEANANHLKVLKKTQVLYALVRALEHRRDMIVQIASRQKAEMQSVI